MTLDEFIALVSRGEFVSQYLLLDSESLAAADDPAQTISDFARLVEKRTTEKVQALKATNRAPGFYVISYVQPVE